jgi:hypothetical protein
MRALATLLAIVEVGGVIYDCEEDLLSQLKFRAHSFAASRDWSGD